MRTASDDIRYGSLELTIIGATGRTGLWVLRKAIAAGHTVRAVVRGTSRLETKAPEIVRGGAVSIVEADMPVRAAENVVAAMKAGAGEKLVWLTGAAVLDERDGKSGSRKVIRGLMKLAAGKVLVASEDAYELVKQSGLIYVVPRPPMLADDPGGTNLSAGYDPPRPIPLAREDLGAFLVEAATSDRYDNESPFVSYQQRGRS